MKNHSKVGNRKNKPAYRTPSSFKARASIKASKLKLKGKAKQKTK